MRWVGHQDAPPDEFGRLNRLRTEAIVESYRCVIVPTIDDLDRLPADGPRVTPSTIEMMKCQYNPGCFGAVVCQLRALDPEDPSKGFHDYHPIVRPRGSVCPTGITPFFRSGAVEFQRWVGVAWDIRQVISNFWTPSESQWMLTPSLSTPSTITTKITICGRPLAVRPLKFAPYAPAYVDSAESHRCGKREAT